MTRDPVFVLSGLMARRKEMEKGYQKLYRAIIEANKGLRKVAMPRVKALVDGNLKKVRLSVEELLALDTYLAQFGDSLAERPLFKKPWLGEHLVAKGELTLVVGSYPRETERRNDVSLWDLRSMGALLSALAKVKPSARIAIRDVLTKGQPNAATPLEEFLDTEKQSICSIGSPRSSLISELMLARMLKVRPFEPGSELPIYFSWLPEDKDLFPSAFTPTPHQLSTWSDTSPNVENRRVRALRVGNGCHEIPRSESLTEWKDYGVVVAQQRASGQIWSVLAGLSGPATFACARAVCDGLTRTLPHLENDDPGAHSDVCWEVVEVTVRDPTRAYGDSREITENSVKILSRGALRV